MAQDYKYQHAEVLQLLTGHYHERSGYRAYREHGVEDWLLIYTKSGSGRFGHAGGELVTSPGDWVLLQPGTLHDYGVETSLRRWDLIWAHFQPRQHWQSLLVWPRAYKGLMYLAAPAPDGARIADRFSQVDQLLSGNLRHRELFAMNALEEVLLLLDHHNPLAARHTGDSRIRRAMDYLDTNFERRIVIEDIASVAGLSPSRLAHLFKTETGRTPQRYLETRRMQRAAELLERTSFSVQQIAAAVGFDSQFYFSQRFKARTRQSPTAFRRSGRGSMPE